MSNTIKILEKDKNNIDYIYNKIDDIYSLLNNLNNNSQITFNGTATTSDVLSGKTFYSNSKQLLTGTLAEAQLVDYGHQDASYNGWYGWTATITLTQKIEKGYLFFTLIRDTASDIDYPSCSLDSNKLIANWKTTRNGDYKACSSNVIYLLDNKNKGDKITFGCNGMAANYIIFKCK